MKHHFLSFCLSTPWALEPGRMRAYAAVLARKYAAKDGLIAEVHAEPMAARASSGPSRANNIAVIPIYGTIVQRASQLGMCEGGTGCQDISSMLSQALADDTVSQILLDIDSPGGSVFGVSELADEIRAARAQKPVVAIANSMAASAAYWLGCSAGEFYVTPGGQVGSIGVWTAHEDYSKALEADGINVTLISAGKYKVEGNPYGPLDEEGLAATQKSVDEYYGMFTAAVAKGRGVPIDSVRNGMGQGRMLGADDAVAQKMVDGVMPISGVIRKMQRDGKAAQRGAGARADDVTLDVLADASAETVVDVAATVTPEQLARASAARARALDLASL
jgi:capsid assembly protease